MSVLKVDRSHYGRSRGAAGEAVRFMPLKGHDRGPRLVPLVGHVTLDHGVVNLRSMLGAESTFKKF